MVESNPNPFAAPTMTAKSRDLPYRKRTRFSGYFYAGIVFCLAMGFGLVFCSALSMVVPAPLAAILTMLPALVLGYWAAARMFHRLDRIHREMIRWEIEQAERIGEFFG